MAQLFVTNRLREIAANLRTEDLMGKIDIVRRWQTDYVQGSLPTDKETSREQQYNQDFFITILGYEQKPAQPYTFEPKASALGGQLPDAVLGYMDDRSNTRHIFAVVELKGATVDLDRPQKRQSNLSPVQQAFKYKILYRDCPFAVVSNFYEFRLYNDNQLDFESWTLSQLVNPSDDYLTFKTWYTLLRRENMVSRVDYSATQSLLNDVRIEQETIGAKFYSEYREARMELLRDLYRRNEIVRTDIDLGIEKAQKIIDRIVFACFAEDRGLLPDDSIARLVRSADSGFGSLWGNVQGFFRAIDEGNDRLGLTVGYNGGLFRNDDALDSLTINDSVIRGLTNLSSYDFDEDLGVPILGHIFEQSITDLEDIRGKVAESRNLEIVTTSRRKTEGIFYTPDYIVRYIVDNVLGSYLREHEEEFRSQARVRDDIKDATYDRREREAYRNYQAFLQNVKVLDPACGSGAFLVHVFDFLLAEHRRVGAVLGDLFSTEEYVRRILQQNIYGVDLNEESVEITKLSLWLKSAFKNEKLTSLDDNIKCGNSLIDDPAVAGRKAFNWQEQFPVIMGAGGFDVVVGNPPYVNARTIRDSDKSYLRENYPQLYGAYDLYVAFLLQGKQLLKRSGRYGWIVPNKFLIADYAEKALEFLVRDSLKTIVDVSTFEVFSNVGVYPIILLGQLGNSDGLVRLKAATSDSLAAGPEVTVSEISVEGFHALAELNFLINSGTTGFEAQAIKGLLNEDERGIPFAVSGSVDPYELDTRSVQYMKDRYFNPYIELGSPIVTESKYRFWESPKIVIAGMTRRIEAVYVEEPLALGVGAYGIYGLAGYEPYAVTAVLNSTFMSSYLREKFHDKHLAGGYLAINKSTIEQLLMLDKEVLVETNLTDLSRFLHHHRPMLSRLSRRFETLIRSEFGLRTWPRSLSAWWNLSFDDFTRNLKRRLSLTQKDELLTIFEKYCEDAHKLVIEIERAEQRVDEIVYSLFGITAS